MMSDKETFQKILAECRLYYKVQIRQYPKRKSTIPNGSAGLSKRIIYLTVKDKQKLYNLQSAVLIHEFGHILDHTVRMTVPLRPLKTPTEIPTNYELEVRAWDTGERHFNSMRLIPKGFKSFRDSCLQTHPR